MHAFVDAIRHGGTNDGNQIRLHLRRASHNRVPRACRYKAGASTGKESADELLATDAQPTKQWRLSDRPVDDG